MSMPCLPLSETKLSIVIDKTKDIILEVLTNIAEMYLAQEEVFKNKEIENSANSSEQKYGKGSKGNKLKAPYKDRMGEVESKPKQFGKPFHYSQHNESLFYKKMMAMKKNTPQKKYMGK